MHSISRRQDGFLTELHEMTKRIEQLAKEEHQLIREVHPVVEKISESLDDVAVAVEAKDALAAEKPPTR